MRDEREDRTAYFRTQEFVGVVTLRPQMCVTLYLCKALGAYDTVVGGRGETYEVITFVY